MANRHQWLICTLAVITLALAPALLAGGGQSSLAAGGIMYVDAEAPSEPHDGSSWEHAYTSLQLALADANAGTQIWVAEGTYKPTDGTDRTISFQMKNGVAIYGGFDPSKGHDTWEERDWELNVTILSGDLNGDDGPGFANNEENSYHVFYHPESIGLDSTAILDGFTISGGNATERGGGGMQNITSSPTLTNCTFRGNSAAGGGGMQNATSSPTLTNCTFSENSADIAGGMANDVSASPTLIECTFSNNSADIAGGMWNAVSSSPTLTNCIFSSNSANVGGGMYNYESSPTLTNCTFRGNSANWGGGMYNVDSSSPVLINCTFSDNSASIDGGGVLNDFSASPTLTNCVLWGDTPNEICNDDSESSPDVSYSDVQGSYPGEGNIDANPQFLDPDNGDLHLHACSPCIDAGNNAAPQLPDYDFEGDIRIVDGNGDGTATVDMGVDEVAVAGTCSRVYLPLVLRGY